MISWIKDSIFRAQPKRLRNYGNGVGKENHKWVLNMPEQGHSLLGDSTAELSQELWHCPEPWLLLPALGDQFVCTWKMHALASLLFITSMCRRYS